MLSKWRSAGLSATVAALALAAIGSGAAFAADKPTVYVIAPSLTGPVRLLEHDVSVPIPGQAVADRKASLSAADYDCVYVCAHGFSPI